MSALDSRALGWAHSTRRDRGSRHTRDLRRGRVRVDEAGRIHALQFVSFRSRHIMRLLYDGVVPDWTFLTNHAHVLLCIARDPGARIRDVAARVGITERAAQRILADLTTAGYLTATREGRRNHYQLNPTLPLRHPLEGGHQIGEILAVLHPADAPAHGHGDGVGAPGDALVSGRGAP